MKRHRSRFSSTFSGGGGNSSTLTQSTLTNGSHASRKSSALSTFSTYLVNRAACCVQGQGGGNETPYTPRRAGPLPLSSCSFSFSEYQPNLDVSYASHQHPLLSNFESPQNMQPLESFRQLTPSSSSGAAFGSGIQIGGDSYLSTPSHNNPNPLFRPYSSLPPTPNRIEHRNYYNTPTSLFNSSCSYASVHDKVEAQGEDGVKRTIPISSSLGGGTPPKRSSDTRVATPQQGSRNSPAEQSPPGYADSPHSASFTSAQSEIDDIIIDEILSLEDEQNRRRGQHPHLQLASSYTYSENLTSLGEDRLVQYHGDSLMGGEGEVEFSRQVSSSAPTSTLDLGGLVQQEFHDYNATSPDDDNSRDRRKKDIHNMIERRRRYNINDRIKELGTLLPKCSTETKKNAAIHFSDMKLNKGTILKASVDYIRSLQREHDNAMRIANKQQQLEQQNRLMAQRIRDLEQQLQHNNLPLPQQQAASSLNGPSSVGRSIKQEPPEESSPAGSHPGGFFQFHPHSQPVNMQQGQQGYGSSQHSPLDPVPSPSVHAAAGLSQLALDPHTYAAGGYNSFGRQASAGNAMFQPISTLETPPVAPYRKHPDLLPVSSQQMQELIMDLNNPEGTGPVLHGDPMLGAQGGSSGVSPEHVQWDAAAFSPDGPGHDQQMDISS